MKISSPIIHVVDDDSSVRRSLERLFRSASYRVETYESADEYLKKIKPDSHGCLILDLRMPGLNGVELQERLANEGVDISIVFISGYGDVKTSVRAMKNLAVV